MKIREICLVAVVCLWVAVAHAANKEPCGYSVLLGGGGQPARGRILGGELATRCEWPWVVGVRRAGGGELCPGVLTGRKKVLTTARCAFALESLGGPIEVVVGEHNIKIENEQQERVIPVLSIKLHPEYDQSCVSNDIAVLRLQRDVDYNICRVPVCTSDTRSDTTCDEFIGECAIAGWGKYQGATTERSSILRWAYTEMMGPTVCSAIYRYADNSTLPESVFCLGKIQSSQPACLGDEGGMVVCNVDGSWLLKGLISLASCDDVMPTLAVDLSNKKINDFITNN